MTVRWQHRPSTAKQREVRGFHAMRARLIERGLISDDGGRFRITEAGMDYTSELLARLETRIAA